MRDLKEDPFVPMDLKDLEKITAILKSRLPRTACMYNTALLLTHMKFDISMYTLHGDLSSNSWIVFIIRRKDYVNDISISVPLNPSITEEVKSAFIATKIFDWEKRYMFTALDNSITPMIVEVGALIKGNSFSVLPSYAFYMEEKYAKEMEIEVPSGFEIGKCDGEAGLNFFLKTWKYTLDGTDDYLKNVLGQCRSVGIYKDGELVSGILQNYNGLLGLLYTLDGHRGKNLAPICMRTLSKYVTEAGMVPFSTAEKQNTTSLDFHEKVGFKKANEVCFIFHNAYKWPSKIKK